MRSSLRNFSQKNCLNLIDCLYTAGKVCEYGVFSCSCFCTFGLNTDIYHVNVNHVNHGKYGTEKTLSLDSLDSHVVIDATIQYKIFLILYYLYLHLVRHLYIRGDAQRR